MARGKQLPHLGEDYLPAPEAPSAVAVRIATEIHDAYLTGEQDPRAFWEMLKRTHPREFAKVLLDNAIPVLAAAEKAAAAPTQSHTRAVVTPIKQRIIDVAG